MKHFNVRRFLAALVLVLALCGPARAAYDTEGRDGYTEATAYIIDSIEDLRALRDNVNAGIEPSNRYYRLASDFNLTQETDWAPIGNVDHPFEGHFDGGGKTLYVDITKDGSSYRGTDYASLFGYLAPASGYAVKNLNVDGSVKGNHWAAGIARTLTSGTIEDCRFTGRVEEYYYYSSDIDTSCIAGIVAEMTGGTIRNCTVSGVICSYTRGARNTYDWAGGIVGQMTGGNVEDCHILTGSGILAVYYAANSGEELVERKNETTYAGGIVGQANLALTEVIRNCTVDATVAATTYAGGIVGEMRGGSLLGNRILGNPGNSGTAAGYVAGGIAGFLGAGGIAENNEVGEGYELLAYGERSSAGGIVGLLDTGTVKDNTSYATVSGSAPYQGGIIGKIDGAVTTIQGNRYSGAEYGIGFNAQGYPSDEGCEHIGASVITITTSSIPGGTVGSSYSFTLQATGAGTIVWSLDSGSLPNGLSLSPSGVISGTPTAAGTSTFTVRAASGTASDAKRFSITIASGGKKPDDKDGGGGGCDAGLGALELLAIVAVLLKRK